VFATAHRAYETYLAKELIGHIDATYRTIASRDAQAMAGVSMGGFGAWSQALRDPDMFAAAARHSGVLAMLYACPHPYVSGKVELIADLSTWSSRDPHANWVRMLFWPDRSVGLLRASA
jgi:S-formylglutathione hydrolase FrmB